MLSEFVVHCSALQAGFGNLTAWTKGSGVPGLLFDFEALEPVRRNPLRRLRNGSRDRR